MGKEQGCDPEDEPPVPEELGCGRMEEQWIAAELGCRLNISQELLEGVEQSCMEAADVELEEGEFKCEIVRCDALVHPNIANLEPPGPKAVLEPSSILAVNTVGEITSNLVKLQNVGTTCLFYSWERISKESIVDKKKVVGRHVTDCWTFSIMKVKGSLLSGETQEFSFKFTSDVPGAFMETWELTTAPKLKGDRLRVSVKGFALLDDTKRENRKRLDKILAYREMQSGYISSVLRSLFERIVAGLEWAPPNSPQTQKVHESIQKAGKRSKITMPSDS